MTKPLFVHDVIRQSIYENKGLNSNNTQLPPLETLMKTEWNYEFEKLMRNRLIMGRIRYGGLHEHKGRVLYDHVGSAINRLRMYQRTGNAEHLVDSANLCLVEFTQEGHENFHFKSADDGYHSPKKTENK